MHVILTVKFLARCAKYGLWQGNQSCDMVADMKP